MSTRGETTIANNARVMLMMMMIMMMTQTRADRKFTQTRAGGKFTQTRAGRKFTQTRAGRNFTQTRTGRTFNRGVWSTLSQVGTETHGDLKGHVMARIRQGERQYVRTQPFSNEELITVRTNGAATLTRNRRRRQRGSPISEHRAPRSPRMLAESHWASSI